MLTFFFLNGLFVICEQTGPLRESLATSKKAAESYKVQKLLTSTVTFVGIFVASAVMLTDSLYLHTHTERWTKQPIDPLLPLCMNVDTAGYTRSM